MSQSSIRIAILWHMHQPDYREPGTNRLTMPWVRLHALKDYLDMPLLASKYQSIRTTFNLVPSLLDQLELYENDGVDRHLELSKLTPEEIDTELKLELLNNFFLGNPETMIKPYVRFNSLYKKYLSGKHDQTHLANLFSSSELRDIQVWSNLVWIDPLFRSDEFIESLFVKDRHYSEVEKKKLLNWQIDHIKRIVPEYKKLLETGNIDISFTPYYHPILPLLCDTNVATESLPSIKLPSQRFVHPEDASKQIELSCKKFEKLFGQPLKGMWPSEGSISDEVVALMSEHGIKWIASDQEVLYHSLKKSNQTPESFSHLYPYISNDAVHLFFRDHALSDRIGFVYSGWDPKAAAQDFIDHIKSLSVWNEKNNEEIVLPIILDGENAWEYFPNDGIEFLDTLYRELENDPNIETVTFSEAVEKIQSKPLTAIFAGSWINHNFRIWIGHEEDNLAWDFLKNTRDQLEEFQEENKSFDIKLIQQAWEQIYIAEGSDWCWWYGDEHRSEHNAEFDRIFRRHLAYVYELISKPVPKELMTPIHTSETSGLILLPDSLITPEIDGKISNFYEWTGAGFFDCVKAGGAMHRIGRLITGIHFAYDHKKVYIRLDFHNRNGVESLKDVALNLQLNATKEHDLLISDSIQSEKRSVTAVIGSIVEIAVDRSLLWDDNYGDLQFNVAVMDGENQLERWPEHAQLILEVPKKNKEFFWPN